MKRSEAIDKAKKLKGLADRGVGGEAINAKVQLEKIMRTHNLSLADIDTETETHEITTGWNIQTDKRKFADNEIVLAGYQKFKMSVEEAYVTLKGWKYKLRFLKNDGTPDKRRSAWMFYAKDIMKCNQKSLT